MPGPTSMETILTFDNRDAPSQYSIVWSTSDVPDRRGGSAAARRIARGRRRLRLGSLALSALLTMHCRLAASTLSGGFFFFMFFLIFGVGALANPMRHFEVYLGQWSLCGPGRAFRIIPMFDGIGLAMCINAILRAILCSVIAAISGIYFLHSVSDETLPFTYCRDFNLTPYDPHIMEVIFKETTGYSYDRTFKYNERTRVSRFKNAVSQNYTYLNGKIPTSQNRVQIKVCNETYFGSYPPKFWTPAYNFFFVEVIRLQHDLNLKSLNYELGIAIGIIWIVIWLVMLSEKFVHGRLVWNNLNPWLVVLPWLWTILLIIIGISNFSFVKSSRREFQVGAEEIIDDLGDALTVALYIHSASVGTELITGKGLNFYAAGHIDPLLNRENVLHSAMTLMLAALHSSGALMCTYADSVPHSVNVTTNNMHQESMLWVIPMYSACASAGGYSHLVSALIFGGLTVSYVTVAYIYMKTAIHTIFEYRVKLVYFEQIVAFVCTFVCMAFSMLFATNQGAVLLESIELYMVSIAMPFVCGMELVGLLYVYRSTDFMSDMDVSTEENTCSSRISMQWRILPFIILATLIMRIATIVRSVIPRMFMLYSLIPLFCLILAVPLRAGSNAYSFLHPRQRRRGQ